MAIGGYKPKRKIFKLVEFADYEGLEVEARSVNTGQFLKIVSLATRLESLGGDESKFTAEDVATIEKLFGLFAKVLRSWNLMDEDENGNDIPVPPTFEGLLSQDLDLVMEVIGVWIDAVGGVDADTGKGSPSTVTSPVPLPPMEALSSNRTN
jgi:hypothetical protein